ncbi:MAG: DegT/DnrJ/EryC1/StrS family aminotransferase [Cryomorphaceae bacterium]
MIPVTRSFIPPKDEYHRLVDRALDSGWITNRGPLVLELEEALKNHLGMPNALAMTNGTLPLQVALSLFADGGEVITTPFSYVATTSAIVWQHCTPVFVDVDPVHWTIDEHQIEGAITDRTTCILATHVFGNPCNVEAIEKLAKKYQLKVIYDAAHCFGVEHKGKSVFHYGDVSTCSFHATKLFHTGEGGALFTNDPSVHQECFSRHNFGHKDDVSFHGIGINAKMSEFQAAMGLCVLPHIPKILSKRKAIVEQYNASLNFDELSAMTIRAETEWNYSYYPVLFSNEARLLNALEQLKEIDVMPRRYFYPSLNNLPYVSGETMPISESIAARILCLPLFVGLTPSDVGRIVDTLNRLKA